MGTNKTAADLRDHKLKISVGERNLGKVSNKATTWGNLLDKMSTPMIDVHHTLKQYLALPKAEQDKLKNVGFFVGGQCDNGVRRIDSIKERWVVTLDVDACTSAQVFDLEAGDTDLAGYEFFVYSTRKHTKDKPRLRIILPLARACEAEAYHALSRILAEKFDASMESIDPVSYRVTQLMYWPSVCAGADFFTFHNPGKMVEPSEVLEAFGDWRDHTKLPRSERDESQFTAAGKKPEDPEKKEGLVGAFCRVYDVPAAIDEFLADIYVDPAETAQGLRYTFAGGTTSHGAIVYDKGKFLYSNHMHDPAAGHSQNAFDLVRIHLFGDLDAKVREGTSPMSMPSVKAMLGHLEGDKAVAKELRDSNYDTSSMFRDMDDEGVFDSMPENTGEAQVSAKRKEDDPTYDPDLDGQENGSEDEPAGDWFDQLDVNGEGVIKPTVPNLRLIMLNDPRLAGACCKNQFSQRVVCRKPLKIDGLPAMKILDKTNGDIWTDLHTRKVRFLLESRRGKGLGGYGLRIADRDMEAAVDLTADSQAFHPVREYLDWLKWDGKPRVADVFIDYLGANNARYAAYYREISRLTFIAGVARIYEPGCKWDHVPIFEGLQGTGKSTFIETLGLGWYRVMNSALEDKNRAIETMSGSWVLEIPELTQFKKSESEKIKDFFSVKSETTRLAFEKRPQEYRRQCIFFGSTNKKEYLKDETGNRRFWPVECTAEKIDNERLRREIDQIWAEAVTLYLAMRAKKPFGDLPLYLADRDVAEPAVEIQESRRVVSEEEEMAREIENWLNTPCHPEDAAGKRGDFGTFDEDMPVKVLRKVVCNAEIAEKVFGYDKSDFTTRNGLQQKFGRAMAMVQGFQKNRAPRLHGDYGVQRVYVRVEDDL